MVWSMVSVECSAKIQLYLYRQWALVSNMIDIVQGQQQSWFVELLRRYADWKGLKLPEDVVWCSTLK